MGDAWFPEVEAVERPQLPFQTSNRQGNNLGSSMERWGAEREASNSQQGQQGKTRHLGQFQEPGNGESGEDSWESLTWATLPQKHRKPVAASLYLYVVQLRKPRCIDMLKSVKQGRGRGLWGEREMGCYRIPAASSL